MNDRLQSGVSGVAVFLVLIIVVAGSFICEGNYSQEPQETPKNANMSVLLGVTRLSYNLEAPDASIAFEIKANREQARKALDGAGAIFEKIDKVTFPTFEMVLTSLGNYYVTGYTSIECGGSTTTASGATCHRASYEYRLTEPTTCAIDPALHDFGDLFYIPAFDRVFIAEDTGSAVKGKHLDLYYWDSEYSEALAITGYYEVFAVEYEYGTVEASKYNITELVWEVQNGQ